MHHFIPGFSLLRLRQRLGVIGLCTAIVFGCIQTTAPVNARDVDSLKQKTESIDAKRRYLKQKRTEKLQQARSITSQIITNQKILDQAQRKLRVQQNQLVSTKTQLSYLSRDIDRLREEEASLKVEAVRRIRRMYMGGRLNMIEMILSASSLTSFLDRVHYNRILVARDDKTVKDLQKRQQQLRQQIREKEQAQMMLGQTINSIESIRSNIHTKLSHDKKLRERYWQDAQYYERAEKQLLAESKRLESEIRSLTARQSQTSDAPSTNKSFAWPLRGTITSNFGYRSHPIHKKRLMHTGLDIARPHGTPITATNDGTVIYSGWRGGYGKVVMINHGNVNGTNIVSLYGHLSSYRVSSGQKVTKGQTIANVGSTGYSTGPHLHFEIRKDGTPTNPRNYLP